MTTGLGHGLPVFWLKPTPSSDSRANKAKWQQGSDISALHPVKRVETCSYNHPPDNYIL